MTPASPDRLVNCTAGDVHVLVDGAPVLLERWVPPVIVERAVDEVDVTFNAGDAGEFELSVSPSEARLVLFLPPETPGVRLLVEPEVLLRCTGRRDLLTPALYGVLDLGGESGGGEDPEGDLPFVSYLVAVHTSLGEVGPDVPVVLDLGDNAEEPPLDAPAESADQGTTSVEPVPGEVG